MAFKIFLSCFGLLLAAQLFAVPIPDQASQDAARDDINEFVGDLRPIPATDAAQAERYAAALAELCRVLSQSPAAEYVLFNMQIENANNTGAMARSVYAMIELKMRFEDYDLHTAVLSLFRAPLATPGDNAEALFEHYFDAYTALFDAAELKTCVELDRLMRENIGSFSSLPRYKLYEPLHKNCLAAYEGEKQLNERYEQMQKEPNNKQFKRLYAMALLESDHPLSEALPYFAACDDPKLAAAAAYKIDNDRVAMADAGDLWLALAEDKATPAVLAYESMKYALNLYDRSLEGASGLQLKLVGRKRVKLTAMMAAAKDPREALRKKQTNVMAYTWMTIRKVCLNNGTTHSKVASYNVDCTCQNSNAYVKALLLNNGTVLFVPGADANITVCNPATRAVLYTVSRGPVSVSNVFVNAVLLNDGKVLLLAQNPAESRIFDPEKQNLSPAISSLTLQVKSATLLDDGRVLLLPQNGNVLGVYDPQINTISALCTLSERIAVSDCLLLPDGRVMLFPATGAVLRVFDPKNNAIAVSCNMTAEDAGVLSKCCGTLMADGNVLCVAQNSSVWDVFSPRRNAIIRSIPVDNVYRRKFARALLNEAGHVVLLPDASGDHALVFDPQQQKNVLEIPFEDARYVPGTLLSSGEIFMFPVTASNPVRVFKLTCTGARHFDSRAALSPFLNR